MTTTPKHPGGRPPKPPGKKYKALLITMPPEMAAWLRAQPDGISQTIQRLITEVMAHNTKPPA